MELKIATSQLPQSEFDHFYPQVLAELEKETSLQDDGRTKRRTIEYGYSYFQLANRDASFAPPPHFLTKLGRSVERALQLPEEDFENIIISVYEPGYHLEPHVDNDTSHIKTMGFAFSENVFGLILEADLTGRLYFVQFDDPGQVPPLDLRPVYELTETRGMVFVLNGPLRHAPYYHGVSTIAQRRLSITFRQVFHAFG